MENLKDLCSWIGRLFEEVYMSKPDCYELSFIRECIRLKDETETIAACLYEGEDKKNSLYQSQNHSAK